MYKWILILILMSFTTQGAKMPATSVSVDTAEFFNSANDRLDEVLDDLDSAVSTKAATLQSQIDAHDARLDVNEPLIDTKIDAIDGVAEDLVITTGTGITLGNVYRTSWIDPSSGINEGQADALYMRLDRPLATGDDWQDLDIIADTGLAGAADDNFPSTLAVKTFVDDLEIAVNSSISDLSFDSDVVVSVATIDTPDDTQAIIDALPKNLNGYTLTVSFAVGTHDFGVGQVVFDDFYNGSILVNGVAYSGPGMLQTTILDSDNTASEAGLLNFDNVLAEITVDSIRFNEDGATIRGLGFVGCRAANITDCSFTGSNTSTGLYVERGYAYVEDCHFGDEVIAMTRGITAISSTMHVNDCSSADGEPLVTGLYAGEASVVTQSGANKLQGSFNDFYESHSLVDYERRPAEYTYEHALPAATTAIYEEHDLSGLPSAWTVHLECVTGDQGYETGDQIQLGQYYTHQQTAFVSSTHYGYNRTSSIRVAHKTNGTSQALTYSYWKIVFVMKD